MRFAPLFSILAVSALSTGASFAATNPDCAQESHYEHISKKELKEVVSKKEAFIVDVNSAESFSKVHVPGAIHYGAHQKDFDSHLPKNKDALIVAYCGGPMCSAWKKAAERACNAGYTNIRHFNEGIKGWVAKGE